jgi:hypothetical protein
MSIPQEMHISFQHLGADYNIDLMQDEKSDHSVKINGISYAVLGDQEKLKTVCEILASMPLDSITSEQDLIERLSLCKDVSFPQTSKTARIGTGILIKPKVPSQEKLRKFEKAQKHLDRLKFQRDHTGSGKAGRAKKSRLNSQIAIQEKRVADLRKDPQIKIKEAYEELAHDLRQYTSKNLKQGALLVQVVGVPGGEKPLVFGKRSVNDAVPVKVNERTIGRTGSGAKLWAGLLTNVLTSKYAKYIQMDDGLGKFAPEEALRKFGRIGSDGRDVTDPQLAKEISVEGLIGMMAGLEYEQPSPKDPPISTLDQFLRGQEISDGSIRILYHPRDNINFYTNNGCFAAYPIEKAYKKVLTDELIEQGKLKETDTLRNLSPKLETFRKHLQEKIEETEKDIKGMRALGVLDNVIEPCEIRLAYLKADLQKLSIPESALDLTLQDLMDCESAYTKPPASHYIYDLLDLFLMPSNNHQVDYAEIMKRELLGPMGMDNSGFHNGPGIHMDLTFKNATTKQDESNIHPENHPMTYGAGFGRTSLSDASKLAKGLADPRGLVGENDETILLTPEALDNFFKPHGHYAGWGLGGAELTCGGRVIDKGGSRDQDQYSFWVDRESGIGMIAMCNCGRRPEEILNAFKEKIERINYPKTKHLVKEKEGSPLGIGIDHYFAHPLVLQDVHQLFEGSRGRIALLFDYDTAKNGMIHWSGTPLEVEKQEDGAFRVTTPGRFQGLIVQKIKGKKSGEDYLAVGGTSFIAIKTDNLPSQESLEKAEKEYAQFRGKYFNHKHPEWGMLEFEVLEDKNGNILLGAREGSKGDFVPQSIVQANTNSISFNGHDRQPPDKIFRFIRESEEAPWRLQVLDYTSKKLIEERPKS